MQYKSSSNELMNIAWCAEPIATNMITTPRSIRKPAYKSQDVSGIHTKAICLINGIMLLIVSGALLS